MAGGKIAKDFTKGSVSKQLLWLALPFMASNALQVLDNGGTIGIFPQGRLPLKGKQFPFTVSTAFIALQANVPIVPVYTDGNYGITKRAGLVIGAPIHIRDLCKEGLDEQAQLAHLTKLLEEKVFSLKEELTK